MVFVATAHCMNQEQRGRVRNVSVTSVRPLSVESMHIAYMVFFIAMSTYPHHRSILALDPGFSREVKEGSVTVLRGHKSGRGVCL